MESFIKADIFFFLTSISVVVITVVVAVVLGYIIYILNDLRHITKRARKQAELLEKDFEDIRDYIRNYGLSLKTWLKIKDIFSGSNKRKTRD